MPRRTFQLANALLKKTRELSVAAPQVVAHRAARLALASPRLTPRDRKEFFGMVAEKQLAFAQSWLAMLTEAARINERVALSAFRTTAWPWSLSSTSLAAGVRQVHGSALAVASKGLAPVHRKAVANAKRLARTTLR